MNPKSNFWGETAKSLPECKAVSFSLPSGAEREEPLDSAEQFAEQIYNYTRQNSAYRCKIKIKIKYKKV